MEEVKISIENKSEIERSISIEIPRSMYNEKYEVAIRKASQQARVKGFRPGRAPRAVIKKLYGTQIHQDVLGELVSSAYHDAVTENDLKVVGYPEIDVDGEEKDEGSFKVTAGVSVFPEPEIEGYFGLKYEVEVEPYKQEMFDNQVMQMREAYADLVEIEGRSDAKLGDTASIDYRGTIDGEEFTGSTAQGSHVGLGTGTLPGNLEQEIVGQEIGQEREISVEMGEQDGAEQAGKTALYVVKLNALFDKKIPEVDDEFAKKSQLGETAEEFNTKLEELMRAEVERRNKTAKEEQFFKTLIEKNTFEVPQAMCDEEIRNFLGEMGLLDPSNPDSRQFDVAGFRETLGEAATFRVRQAVALNAIIEKEKVEAQEKDVEAWLEARAEQESRTRKEVDQVYGFPKNVSQLQRMVARENLLVDLIAKAKITEVEKKTGEEKEEEKAKEKAA